jgi:hypothetical protein
MFTYKASQAIFSPPTQRERERESKNVAKKL